VAFYRRKWPPRVPANQGEIDVQGGAERRRERRRSRKSSRRNLICLDSTIAWRHNPIFVCLSAAALEKEKEAGAFFSPPSWEKGLGLIH